MRGLVCGLCALCVVVCSAGGVAGAAVWPGAGWPAEAVAWVAVVQDSAGQEKADAPRAEGVQGVAETEPAEEVEEALPRAEGFPPWPVVPEVDIVHSEALLDLVEDFERETLRIVGREREAVLPQFGAVLRVDKGQSDSFISVWTTTQHRDFTARLLATQPGSQLSPEQRRFIENSSWCFAAGSRRSGLIEETEYVIYAVSRKDAELMIRAVMETWLAPFRGRYEAARDELKKIEDEIAKREAQIEEYQQRADEVKAKVEKLRGETPYTSSNEAYTDIAAISAKLRDIDVEVVGIEAMRAAITKAKEANKSTDMQQLLDQMMIEQDVRLAGVLARKGLMERMIERAQAYRNADSQYIDARNVVGSIRARIEELKPEADKLRKSLARPGSKFGRPSALDPAIVVRPVHVPERLRGR